MKAIKVKILLLEKGLNISDMARQLCESSDVSFNSMRQMLSDLLYGKQYYPTLAEKVRTTFGIEIARPAHLQPIRQALKQAA